MRRTTLTFAISALIGVGAGVSAQEPGTTFPIVSPADAKTHGLEDLRTAIKSDGGVPLPNLSAYLNSGAEAKRALKQLGKILFWDQQVGSKGQACASCHFNAGADIRSKNQLNPNIIRRKDSNEGPIRGYHDAPDAPDNTFHTKQPNQTVKFADYPFIKTIQAFTDSGGLIGPAPGNSNDVTSSMGVLREEFRRTVPADPEDRCRAFDDPVFKTIHGKKVRRVEPRNTPTMINAVLNAFNFWDGRANHFFNGQNPFGVQDPDARILVFDGTTIVKKQIKLRNSSLASQAVGPPLSDFEMSCGVPEIGNARTWPEIGRKLLRKRNGTRITPLGLQMVAVDDSLIGGLSNYPAPGVSKTYTDLVKMTFQKKYWKAPGLRVRFDGADVILPQPARPVVDMVNPQAVVTAVPDEVVDDTVVVEGEEQPPLTEVAPAPTGPKFTLMEANFALFFGLAVQAYEAMLLSDNSWFDKWMRTGDFNAGFGEAERKGLNIFVGKGSCINCHGGPEMTNASVRNFQRGNNLIEPMAMGNNDFAIYDNGFYNISVTPTTDDIGRGNRGPTGAPLASSRQRLFEEVLGIDIPFPIIGRNKVPAVTEDEGEPVCDDTNGNGLCGRNDPLFPNFQRVAVDGAFKTPGLRNIELQGPYFHSGSAATLKQVVEFYDNGGNFCSFNLMDLDPDIQSLELTEQEKKQLVKFLMSLTDKRVAYEKKPFDHPSLTIPIDGRKNGTSMFIPAVGAGGLATPIGTFLGLNPQNVGQAPVGAVCSKDANL